MRTTWLLLSAVLTTSLAGCHDESPDNDEVSQGVNDNRFEAWRLIRAFRQAELDQYNADHADQYASFKNAALGTSGIPMIMLRLFPELFPQIWGAPGDHFAPVGLGQDTLEPSRVLPLGLGYAPSSPPIPTAAGPVHIQVVQLTCAGCHTGRVLHDDGSVQHLIGAPSTQFTRFRGSVFATVNQPTYTAANFLAALNAKPAGWVYGDPAMAQQEALERLIFNSPGVAAAFLANLKTASVAGAQRFALTLGAHTYQTPNSPNPSGSTPGYLDAIGAGITLVVDPAVLTPAEVKAVLPPFPAMIDIMSVWAQQDRPTAQWDGSISSPLHRNLAAELGVVGNPTKLNMDNVNKTTPYTDQLPPPPYPFDIDSHAAKRGRKLYERYCESCHTAGNATIFSTASVGTDVNRAIIWTPYTMAGLTSLLRIGCTDPVTCNKPDGTPFSDAEIIRSTGGYMALPLDGIWARAPYLHNGSVPTLHALLTGDRPAQFQRGNIAYDQAKVGFVSDVATPYSAVFDTTKSGNSSAGHNTPAFNGDIDWNEHPKKLEDLLAYLKTL